MKKTLLIVAALAATNIAAAQAAELKGAELAKSATVTLATAEATALKARPGKVTDKELEKEKGGSGLRYSFDITGTDGKAYEVGVDARTGKVLENAVEGKNPD